MSVVIIRNEIVHYEVLGRGRPLLFLHSWVGSWRYWMPAMQSASISFRTYALDLWGFGDSAKGGAYSLAEQHNLLQEFITAMGIGKLALVGHGLGALVALQYTAQHPEQIDRMMLVSMPFDKGGVNGRLNSASPAELADWLLGRSPQSEAARIEAPKADRRAIQASLTDLESLLLREQLHNLATPCLFVYGWNDPSVTPPPLEETVSLPATSHWITLDESGHFPMLDETPKFNRLLMDFLSLPSGQSPRELQLKEEWKRRVR
jgi:pimeloyl-ACP methyl ester carboxylesterase